jgi:hypothetical protein
MLPGVRFQKECSSISMRMIEELTGAAPHDNQVGLHTFISLFRRLGPIIAPVAQFFASLWFRFHFDSQNLERNRQRRSSLFTVDPKAEPEDSLQFSVIPDVLHMRLLLQQGRQEMAEETAQRRKLEAQLAAATNQHAQGQVPENATDECLVSAPTLGQSRRRRSSGRLPASASTRNHNG